MCVCVRVARSELRPGMLLAEIQRRAIQPIRDAGDRDRRFQEVHDTISQRNLDEDFVLGFKPVFW